MYETADLILVAILAVLIGLAVGASLHRGVSASATRIRSLEKKLAEAQESSQQYKENVTQHFAQTAELVTDLTLKYKEVHDHLANGVDQLCRDEQGHALLANSPLKLSVEESSAQPEPQGEGSVQPPLDYAPREAASASGQLAEDFGLEKIRPGESYVPQPVPGAFAAETIIKPQTSATGTDGAKS